ncbi:MAG TPA: glycosyltransferase family 4 protein, partial [Bdellovibrionales bacterium]|nr:glycosyltransferase family 4 protein [Bdellovibrionales bacterium]
LEAVRGAGLADPFVIVPKAEGPLLRELATRGFAFEVLELPRHLLEASRRQWASSLAAALLRSPSGLAYLSRLVRLLRARKARVLHTTGIKMHILGAAAGPLAGARVLWHLRDIFGPGKTRALMRALELAARPKVIANSRATAASYGASAEVVYNGIDTDAFRPDPALNVKRELGAGDGLPVVGICGVLTRWKGQREFVAAAADALRAGHRAHFVIVGDEIYDTTGERGVRAELESLIKESGFETHIRIAGFRNDMPRVYNSLDLLVHASTKPEPFGRVLIEAMACGVPVIASRDGGVLEIVTDGSDGLLFAPGDTAELGRHVARVLADETLRARLGREGRKTVERRFSSRVFRERFNGVLKELL